MYIYIYIYICIYIYIYVCIYIYICVCVRVADKITYCSQWTWPKVGDPLLVVKVCTSMVCKKNRVSVSGWSPICCEVFYTNLNIPCPLLTTSVFR